MGTKPFEIGLVGAGAVSAGAYTGGVLDYLVQALDAWHAAKAAGEAVPPHEVRLKVFAGASAGAVTAALAAGALGSDQPPIATPADAARLRGRNKLYDAWVDRTDIKDLLGDRDLKAPGAPVVSLLDSTILREIADLGLAVTPRKVRRPWLAEDFHLLLTVTNLRGVPYAIPLDAGMSRGSHTMSLHADFAHFCLNDSGKGPDGDVTYLPWGGLPTAPEGRDLKLAALASSAFPVGLAPQVLGHDFRHPGDDDCYSRRLWPIPLDGTPGPDGRCQCTESRCIPVDWGQLPADYKYRFLCVDGGVMNNEPMELARQVLAGPGGRNPRGGDEAHRAVLMIDPFPSEPLFDPKYEPDADIFGIVMKLFGALKNQTRFKPDELMLAAHEKTYSRFMIAPSRDGSPFPIACGALGGFSGFLSHAFRRHDFFLGRRNAQKFLKDHLVLPETNPLFTDWPEALKEAHCVRDAKGAPQVRDGVRLLPIIPRVGTAQVPCEALPWPSYGAGELATLTKAIERRLGLVLDRLVDQYFAKNNLLVRQGARLVARFKKDDLSQKVIGKIEADLKRFGLMR